MLIRWYERRRPTALVVVALLTGTLAIPLAACKHRGESISRPKEAFDDANDPYKIVGARRAPYDRAVPASAKLQDIPWPGYYWATYRGGIAFRWLEHEHVASGVLANASYRDFLYEPYSPEAARALNTQQIASMSPAEKYDLLSRSGGGGFPVTRAQQDNTRAAAAQSGGEVPTWFGICHGWAPAAALESRPGPELRVLNAEGQCITFYWADLEALASQFYANANFDTGFLGSRCNVGPTEVTRRPDGRVNEKECRDVNPAALHLALGTLVGGGVSFVADVTYSDEVWNQPIYAYRLRYGEKIPVGSAGDRSPRADRASTATAIVPVTAEMDYIVESSPTKAEVDSTRYIKTAVYKYTLELDAQDFIVGGEWDPAMTGNPQSKWPDFLWQARQRPSGTVAGMSYDRIHDLISKSRQNGGKPVDLCAAGSGSTPTPVSDPGSNPQPDPSPDTVTDPQPDPSPGTTTDDDSGGMVDSADKPLPALPQTPEARRPLSLPPIPAFVAEPTRPWLPPFDPKWNPKADFCAQQAGEKGCNRAQAAGQGCGWSLGVNRCLNVRSKVCHDYPDRQWCELGSGYLCEWDDSRSACVYTGPTVQQAKQNTQGGRP